MKKLTAILMVLLCAFSLSAEWGRIQYIDEFGDVDHTISDPYQVVDGTKERNGRTDLNYEFRLLASIPPEFGSTVEFVINVFDEFGDYVQFDNGGIATIRVKLTSGDVKEFTYDFDQYDDTLDMYSEFALESLEEDISLSGNDAVELANDLYKGNDLKFVIYYGDDKYNFSIEADGFKEVADEFIPNFEVSLEPIIHDEPYYFFADSYIPAVQETADYVLLVRSIGFPDYNKYPTVFLFLDYKGSEEPFWYVNEKEFVFRNVELVSADGKESLSLNAAIDNTEEYSSDFILYDSSLSEEIIEFAESNTSMNLVVEFEPSVVFNIPLSSDELLSFISFPE